MAEEDTGDKEFDASQKRLDDARARGEIPKSQDLAARGVVSVAAPGFGAPGVVVSYTADPNIQNGSAFRALGLQIAAGVPLQVGEGEGFRTFRLGLFGLDKLVDPAATMARLTPALDTVLGQA